MSFNYYRRKIEDLQVVENNFKFVFKIDFKIDKKTIDKTKHA